MDTKCPECYGEEVRFWRDAPMNEEIRKIVTYQKHANQYYYTLDEAMAVWGTQIEENDNVPHDV